MTVRVTVVVPTYRRPDLLGRCLAALLAQDLPPADYEVVVADNAGCPDTAAQVKKWSTGTGPVVRYVTAAQRPGPAAARNAGWRAAAAPLIAFTDDDCVPDPGWLRAGLAALAAGADVASGRVRVPLPGAPTDYERNESGLEVADFVTANGFCRRAALEAVGGFDERFTTAWREDSDLFFTLLERGYRWKRADEALVVHPVRRASWGVSLRQQSKSMFNALLYKKHPGLYCRRVQPAPPWHYYLTVAALLAVPALLAAGQAAAALAAGALWLGLTGRFCLRRLWQTSRHPRHVAEMLVTSALIPPLSVFWRLRGAVRFRVLFL